MRQLPAREGLTEIFEFVKKKYFVEKFGINNNAWLARCMNQTNIGYGDYVRHFSPDEVAMLNAALQELSRNIKKNVEDLPDYSRENRNDFLNALKKILVYVKSAPLKEAIGIKPVYWPYYTTQKEGKKCMYFKPEQVAAIIAKLEYIANLLADIELVYEPLDG